MRDGYYNRSGRRRSFEVRRPSARGRGLAGVAPQGHEQAHLACDVWYLRRNLGRQAEMLGEVDPHVLTFAGMPRLMQGPASVLAPNSIMDQWARRSWEIGDPEMRRNICVDDRTTIAWGTNGVRKLANARRERPGQGLGLRPEHG